MLSDQLKKGRKGSSKVRRKGEGEEGRKQGHLQILPQTKQVQILVVFEY